MQTECSKLLMAIVLTCFCSIFYTAIPSNAMVIEDVTAVTSQNETIVPYADVIVWRYMIVDGKVYRRQYNSTKLEWIGHWELVA